ncbi:MAG: chemotaxis protein CheV [Deferribacteraceae bacterium]|jgi:two-component system chemotaxis response regulator CheV|nr:chemotaxis protein CheV [Deferribacteraceae bacterium]
MALNHNILLEAGTNEFEIVEFVIRSSDRPYHFCINVAKVREVIRFPEVVHVPDAHKSIIGTANIRQNLVPIIDLGYWLGLRETSHRDDSKVIVTYFNHMNNGFMVDEVVRIHRITWAEIRDYSSITDFHMIESVLGVINIQERMIQLLDFESIISEINPGSNFKNSEIDMTLADKRKNFDVYLAEDSPVIRRLLVQHFTKAGYRVRAFENGAGLIKEIDKKVPDVVITDLEMPAISGDYVVKKLRESFSISTLPIVVFSSMASEENERKLVGLGANRFIGKPDISMLVTIIDGYLLKR